jgi:hypothetical protein
MQIEVAGDSYQDFGRTISAKNTTDGDVDRDHFRQRSI